MATTTLWSNVQVAMQSALGADKTITAITKANPGEATSTSHGILDGAYVVLDVSGMYQVDERVFRVDSPATNTFLLEGENTTNYTTFTSGLANEITFGTTLSVLTSLNASGGGASFVDVTTIHDNIRKQVPGVAEAAVYSFEAIWDVSDAGLIALKAASDAQSKRAFKFTFASGQIMVFNGYVNATLLPTGSNQDLVKTSVEITMFGTPTYYAS